MGFVRGYFFGALLTGIEHRPELQRAASWVLATLTVWLLLEAAVYVYRHVQIGWTR